MDHGTLRILLDTSVWGGIYQKLLELGYSDILVKLYDSLWSAIRIMANGGAIILIALQRVGTISDEYY